MNVPTELFDFVNAPDSTFGWEIVESIQRPEVLSLKLRLTSQTWHDIVWTHDLYIFIPEKPAFTDLAILTVGADRPVQSESVNALGAAYAERTHMVCAFLYDIPNQPLFGELIEDALIAHTFVQCLDTGDMSWPLLFPMTKAVVRAMDAVEAVCGRQGSVAPSRFLVTGASKRGWTTWLTAVVDARVAGIVPVVYDNLNLFAQMPHQVEVSRGYSEQISDYTRAGLPQRMVTPEGIRLAYIIDPYTYRENLTLPKLIINGSNDRYWSTDALNLYWDALVGPKYILYVPNAGHSTNDPRREYATSIAFVRSVATGQALPELTWRYESTDSSVTLVVESGKPARSGVAWIARSATRDFRDAEWQGMGLQPDGDLKRFSLTVARPSDGCLALHGEITFVEEDLTYTRSTQIQIVTARA